MSFLMIFFCFLSIILVENGCFSTKCDATIKENSVESFPSGIDLNINISGGGQNIEKAEILQYNQFFSINPTTGFLQTIRQIDREFLCQTPSQCSCLSARCDLKLTIFVTKKSNEPPDKIERTICVDDVNDNKPFFPENFQNLEINENAPIGTMLELYSAQDSDSYIYSVQRYVLRCPDNYFNLSYHINNTVESNSMHRVRIQTIRSIPFSYEAIQCTLTACDDEYCSEMRLNVKINDVNDKIPQWEKEIYDISIKENIPRDSLIYRFIAKDDDPIFGKVSYSIAKISTKSKQVYQNIFNIDPVTGELRVTENLDYEERLRVFNIIIVAKDNGNPPLSNSATAVITVEDVNDNPPAIKLNRAVIEIHENTPPRYLDYLSVSDLDENANGKISCSVTEQQNSFYLKQSLGSNFPMTFELYSSQSFDYEKQKMFTITIRCEDHGKPNLMSEKQLIIKIINKNDNRVYFEQKMIYAYVPESAPIGTEIVKLSAIDLDKTSQLVYSVVDQINTTFVNVDSSSGYITSNEAFNREERDTYIFKVRVVERDEQNFSDIAEVVLKITDVNDNKPQFQQLYTFSLPENTSLDYFVGKVKAVDPDNGENGTISFYQMNGIISHPVYFTVSSLGEIRLIHQLDFEKQSMHQLIIVARDNGIPSPLSSSTTVLITVTDSNDHPPRFEERSFTLNIQCQTQTIGKDFITVNDKDQSPENTIVHYRIEHIDPIKFSHLFKIDDKTGTISMDVKKDDCDLKHLSKLKIDLTLSAYDPTKPEFTDKAHLYFNIENEKYQKQITDKFLQKESRNWENSGLISGNNGGKQEGSPGTGDIIDQNIIVIMILIFITIFLGMVLVGLICFLRKRKQSDEQAGEEASGMIREKLSASHISSKCDLNDVQDPSNRKMKAIETYPNYYPLLTNNLTRKPPKAEKTFCSMTIDNLESKSGSFQSDPMNNHSKDNINYYKSSTMSSKMNDLDQPYSPLCPIRMATLNPLDDAEQRKVQTSRAYASVSFV